MKTKITKASIKSFIKKNEGKLYIRRISDFSPITDCVEEVNGDLEKVEITENSLKNTLGVNGLWLAGGSNDTYTEFETKELKGFNIYNCCGEVNLVIKK